MNRAVKFNYLFIGVIGGMLAMWACGDDTTGSGGSKSSGGSTAAHAQESPSSCKKWSVSVHEFDVSEGSEPSLDTGEEPFAASLGFNSHWLHTRRCIED